ncbi:sulfurtransferase, partial [Halarcobacter bivalviorum]
MIAKIDINSIEFKNELENTKKFTKDVLEKHNLVFNPDFEVVESIEMGLTRNQLIYGKKYCPC